MYNAIKNKEKKDFYLRKIRKFIGFVNDRIVNDTK